MFVDNSYEDEDEDLGDERPLESAEYPGYYLAGYWVNDQGSQSQVSPVAPPGFYFAGYDNGQ